MPLSDAALDKAAKDLDQVELQSFKATPSTILPFQQSELRWKATAPIGVQFRLDGKQVPRIGSQVVRPNETRTFRLTAHAGPLSDLVGQVTVTVDLGACTTISIEESTVQEVLDNIVGGILAKQPQLKKREPAFVDVTPDGIVLKLRFEIEVACSRNPDFNVDALIGLRIEGNEIVPFYKSFTGSLDYSALEDALNYTIGAFLGLGPQFAIAIAEDNAESEARKEILDGVRAAIEMFLAAVPSGSAPNSLGLSEDAIEIRLCPLSGFKRVVRVPQNVLTLARNGVAPSSSGPRVGPKKSGSNGSKTAKRATARSTKRRRQHGTSGTKSNGRGTSNQS